MDLNKCLKGVTNLNEYISFTRDVENKYNSIKITFNMSTVLSLKKIRAIEIEYFNKYEENGAAIRIFELMLRLPPMKTWSLLGKELVCLLQYWLEALRKHLILHNVHWWEFLKLILKFIKDIRLKDASINNMVIEETADCLLDLATSDVPDILQRFEIVQNFNSCAADSSRKIRFALKNRFESYFVKLSTIMATSGDFRVQYSMLETLLRWLLPRHERAVRHEAAAKWFPPELYSRDAVSVFLERTWQNFTKDARDFLNAHNVSSELVVSTTCKKLTVGSNVCISGRNKKECWIDVNSSTKCISILLDARICEELGGVDQICDVIVITDENTRIVRLNNDSAQVVVSVNVLDLSQVYPFSEVIQSEVCNDIHVQVEASCLLRLNIALRNIFGDKYQTLFDVGNMKPVKSPEMHDSFDIINNSEEDTRFSNPVQMVRRKHSGFIARRKNPRSWNSPSTVSTSSLAQLHDKLVALPHYTYDKEPVSVCALPQLSSVTEVSETEENLCCASVSKIRLRSCGVCNKNKRSDNTKSHNKGESIATERKILSPVVNDDEHSVSCLLLATIGSADDSIINDTIERLPKDVPCNTDNIVDLLAQEALQGTDKVVKQDGNINTGTGTSKTNNTHINEIQTNDHCSEKQNIISNLTIIDESSNEVVDYTQINDLNIKRRLRSTKNTLNKQKKAENNSENNKVSYTELTFDVQAVEDFFSQHFCKNKSGDLVLSPTLARKINETSSDNSEEFDSMLPNQDILQNLNTDLCLLSDVDVVECLNAMVDKVCEEFDKCAAYLNQEKGKSENVPSQLCHTGDTEAKSTKDSSDVDVQKVNTKMDTRKDQNQPIKTIKLKYTSKLSKLSLKKTLTRETRMSPIIEIESANEEPVTKNEASLNVSNKPEDLKTPLTSRKRKLYSPKDEPIVNEDKGLHVPETEGDDTPARSQLKCYTRTPKSIATCYKELENERKKRIRQPRTRKFKTNKPCTTAVMSPRTKKNNEIFDGLKEVVTGTEKVTLVDKDCPSKDIAVYNYTSESDDDDTKKTKPNLTLEKRKSTEQSVEGDVKRRRKRNDNTEKDNGSTVKTTKKIVKRNQQKQKVERKQTKIQKRKVPQISELKSDLEDERMRADIDKLDTSEVIECPLVVEVECTNKEPPPVLKEIPEMEYIEDNTQTKTNKPDENAQNSKQSLQKTRPRKLLSLKKPPLDTPSETKRASVDCENENEGTMSPLPGLVVETVLVTEADVNDSVTSNMFQRFKDMYQNKQIPPNSELNTTQNILSDFEALNSPVHLNVSEDDQDIKVRAQAELNNNKPLTKIEKDTKTVNKNKQPNKQTRKKNNVNCKPNKGPELTHKSETVLSLSSEYNDGKSIATLGNTRSPITGHGDFNEEPPNPTLLEDDVEPRNMETEYLSESLKGFFNKLTRELNQSPEKQTSINPESPKKPSTNDELTSISDKSPVIAVTRLSSEDISRWLPSRHNSISSSEGTKFESVKVSAINKPAHTHTVEDIDKTPRKIHSEVQEIATYRKTIISPIRLNNELEAAEKNNSVPYHADDGCLNRIRKILSVKKESAIKSDISSGHPKKVAKITKKNHQKHLITSSACSKAPDRGRFRAESTNSRDSSSALKRESSPLLPSPKKLKLNMNKDKESSKIARSTTSVESISDWFKRNEHTHTDDSLLLSIKDNIKCLLEKLDTTLVEIHHNTSKRFINMFVDAQKDLNALKEERRQMYKQAASEIMTDIMKIMDAKFADLDNRSQSMDDKFMKSIRERSHELIRQDCKQKQLMVTLLREDTQAVLDYMSKGEWNELP